MNIPDLWPSLLNEAPKVTPLTILQRQAELLNEKTQDLLNATVSSHGDPENTCHRLAVCAPKIGFEKVVCVISHSYRYFPVYGGKRHSEGPPLKLEAELWAYIYTELEKAKPAIERMWQESLTTPDHL